MFCKLHYLQKKKRTEAFQEIPHFGDLREATLCSDITKDRVSSYKLGEEILDMHFLAASDIKVVFLRNIITRQSTKKNTHMPYSLAVKMGRRETQKFI